MKDQMTSFGSNRTAIATTMWLGVFGIVFVSKISLSSGFSPRVPANNKKYGIVLDREDCREEASEISPFSDGVKKENNNRRGFLVTGLTAFLPWAMTAAATRPTDAKAFENRLNDRYADAIPQTGKQPKDLGHSQRSNYVGLKECGNSPNCWNSSAPKSNIPARWLPAWEANGRSIEDVKRIVDTYEVGHDDIDGGGFKIMEYNNNKKEPDDQYLYVQFQSYKAGYIDDFECWFNSESKKFDVRSSSRVGYSDLGVNASRLEYIANRLEKEYGWTFNRRKNGRLV